jgi:hypothetical protein
MNGGPYGNPPETIYQEMMLEVLMKMKTTKIKGDHDHARS